jgi:type II secretory ATPase GspE/PulE/Tfp pilus assembly ATPase PilB-like protein
MLAPDEELTELIVTGASENRVREVSLTKGMRTLRADAAEKVLAGITSMAEMIENTVGAALE